MIGYEQFVSEAVKNVDVSLMVINIVPGGAMHWKQALTSDEKTRRSQLCTLFLSSGIAVKTCHFNNCNDCTAAQMERAKQAFTFLIIHPFLTTCLLQVIKDAVTKILANICTSLHKAQLATNFYWQNFGWPRVQRFGL